MEQTALMKAVGDVIQNFRVQAGRTRPDIERAAGLARHQLYKIERGQRRLDVCELVNIAHALNMSAAHILEVTTPAVTGEAAIVVDPQLPPDLHASLQHFLTTLSTCLRGSESRAHERRRHTPTTS